MTELASDSVVDGGERPSTCPRYERKPAWADTRLPEVFLSCGEGEDEGSGHGGKEARLVFFPDRATGGTLKAFGWTVRSPEVGVTWTPRQMARGAGKVLVRESGIVNVAQVAGRMSP